VGELRAEGFPPVAVSPPPEFQGQEGTWTPEHLFVASVNSCFMSAFLAIAENSKLEIVTFLSKARGKLEKIEGSGYQITEILLKPELVIRGAKDLDRAERILQKAEKNCFISNSIKTVVKLEPEIHQE
jgi:organic hydroperoxide reductase OsmC/OhrA